MSTEYTHDGGAVTKLNSQLKMLTPSFIMCIAVFSNDWIVLFKAYLQNFPTAQRLAAHALWSAL